MAKFREPIVIPLEKLRARLAELKEGRLLNELVRERLAELVESVEGDILRIDQQIAAIHAHARHHHGEVL